MSIDRLIDAVSRRSEPEAAFMLVALNAKGRLAGGDWARAAPIVRRLNERLKAREPDGEVSAAAWRAPMGVIEGGILSEDYGRRIAKASGLPAPAAGPEPMLATSDAFSCLRDRSIEIAASALAGARGGDALAMLLVIPSFRRDLTPVDPAAVLDCGPWRNDGRDPVATSAYLSCLTYASGQRIVGLKAQANPGELGRATGAAINAGAVGAIIAVTANPDQRSFSNAVKSALRNASEQEGSPDALFELGMEYGRWNGVERDSALAARYLEKIARRTPVTRDGHGAALGFQAAMYDVGGFRLKADDAAFQRTVAGMRELPAEQLNEGAQRLGMWQMGDPRGPASTTPRAVTVRSELLRLAAERVSLVVIGNIVGDGGAEERAAAAALSSAKGDMDVVEEDCRDASEEAADLAGRRVAERKCDLAARVGHVEASALIVRMYGDDSPPALRSARASLAGPAYRRTKTADAALARVESGSSGVDMAGIEARLRSSAAFYDATTARSLMELMLDGRIAWSDEYARRLAPLFVTTAAPCSDIARRHPSSRRRSMAG